MPLRRSAKWAMTLVFCGAGIAGAEADVRLADAAKHLNRPNVRALLQQHVDVNAAEADGTTALHWAAYNDDLETAEILLRAGANVKAANQYGVSPLSLACTNGSGP